MIKDEKKGQVITVDTMEKCHNLESDNKLHEMPTSDEYQDFSDTIIHGKLHDISAPHDDKLEEDLQGDSITAARPKSNELHKGSEPTFRGNHCHEEHSSFVMGFPLIIQKVTQCSQ